MTRASQPAAVSIRALAKLTGLDRDYILRRIEGMPPAGTRAGHPVYRLQDVLPALCRPATIPGSDLDVDPDMLSPVDRRHWYDSELKRRQLQIRDRDLIPTEEVQGTVSRAFAVISQNLLSLPDSLERRAGISPELAEQAENVIHASMNALADSLATLGTDPSPDHDEARQWLLDGLGK